MLTPGEGRTVDCVTGRHEGIRQQESAGSAIMTQPLGGLYVAHLKKLISIYHINFYTYIFMWTKLRLILGLAKNISYCWICSEV